MSNKSNILKSQETQFTLTVILCSHYITFYRWHYKCIGRSWLMSVCFRPFYKILTSVCSTELQISLCAWVHNLVGFTLSLHMWNISGLDASFELLAQGLATYVFVVRTSSSPDAWRPTFADSVNDRIVSPSPCLGHLVAHFSSRSATIWTSAASLRCYTIFVKLKMKVHVILLL